MNSSNIKLEASWKEALSGEFEKPYFLSLTKALRDEKRSGTPIYPQGDHIFYAFEKTPFESVKAVIIGQDPYHNPGQAMGLSFSVPQGIPIPASLKNIYKEIQRDLDLPVPNHGDLTSWAEQGVLMLNSVLTVRHKSPGSHKKLGWQSFTDVVIRLLSQKKENIVFLLWGNYAKSKNTLIDELKHYILESAHPSPLAGNKFQGNSHFSKTNELLLKHNIKPINWQIK